jgi:hypothetical protein
MPSDGDFRKLSAGDVYNWLYENPERAQRMAKNFLKDLERGEPANTAGDEKGDGRERQNGDKKLASTEQLNELARRFPSIGGRS